LRLRRAENEYGKTAWLAEHELQDEIEDVELCSGNSGTIQVRISEEDAASTPPIAFCESYQSVDCGLVGIGHWPALVRRRIADGYEFRGVPDACVIRLWGRDASGGVLERRLEIDRGGSSIVPWP